MHLRQLPTFLFQPIIESCFLEFSELNWQFIEVLFKRYIRLNMFMRFLFPLFLFIQLNAFAQFVVEVQKEYCIADSARLELIWVNHTDHVFKTVEFVDKYPGVQLFSPNVMDLGNSWTFYDSDGLIRILCEESLRILGTNDSAAEIQLENNCTYTFNVFPEADSPSFWYTGYSFILPIYFELLSPNCVQESEIVLNSLVKTMNNYPNLAFEIRVHADERYPNELSTCLSCKRAESIRNYLIDNGMNPKRVTAKGYNDSKPKIRNAKTEEQHQQNRRVEIRIISVDFSE